MAASHVLASMPPPPPRPTTNNRNQIARDGGPKKSVGFPADDDGSTSSTRSGNSIFQQHIAKLTAAKRRSDDDYQPDITPSNAETSNIGGSRHYQQQNQNIINSLTHLSPKWPGETGGGQPHLDVRPMIFHDLLSKNQIVIPLFQRRYCWTKTQIRQWYQDISNPSPSSSDLGGIHRTHKTMFKRDRNKNDGRGNILICIDGQQRITTTMLFLCALRTECRKASATTLVKEIDDILLLKKDNQRENKLATVTSQQDGSNEIQDWADEQAKQYCDNGSVDGGDTVYVADNNVPIHDMDNKINSNSATGSTMTKLTLKELPIGWLPPFEPTLIPSYVDRASFFEILSKDYIEEAIDRLECREPIIPDVEVSDSCRKSVQYMAYRIFKQELHALVKRTTATYSPTSVVKTLQKLLRKQVYGFSLMYIELLSAARGTKKEINMQQIFLWMQEKTIFGMGRLLFNPHPGVDFTPIDLARNLIVSCVMNEPSLEKQMEFYKECWIVPLELRFSKHGSADDGDGSNGILGKILSHFVKRVTQSVSTDDRYIGDMEEKLNQYKSMVPHKLRHMFDDDMPMMVYAKFHSYVQQRAIDINVGAAASNVGPTTTSNDGSDVTITKTVADTIVKELVHEGIDMGL